MSDYGSKNYDDMLKEVHERIDRIPCIFRGWTFKTQEDADKIKEKLKEINMCVEVMEGCFHFKEKEKI